MSYASPRSREYFIGAKTHGVAVPVIGIMRDLLILQALDPNVAAVGHIGSLDLDGRRHWIDAHTVTRVDGTLRLLRIVSRAEEPTDLAPFASHLGGAIETVMIEEVVAEPRLSTAREIWSFRRIQVPTATKTAVVRTLREEGPMTLDRLCRCAPGPRDPHSVVMSLLCSADIEFIAPLGPEEALERLTMLRSRG